MRGRNSQELDPGISLLRSWLLLSAYLHHINRKKPESKPVNLSCKTPNMAEEEAQWKMGRELTERELFFEGLDRDLPHWSKKLSSCGAMRTRSQNGESETCDVEKKKTELSLNRFSRRNKANTAQRQNGEGGNGNPTTSFSSSDRRQHTNNTKMMPS